MWSVLCVYEAWDVWNGRMYQVFSMSFSIALGKFLLHPQAHIASDVFSCCRLVSIVLVIFWNRSVSVMLLEHKLTSKSKRNLENNLLMLSLAVVGHITRHERLVWLAGILGDWVTMTRNANWSVHCKRMQYMYACLLDQPLFLSCIYHLIFPQ